MSRPRRLTLLRRLRTWLQVAHLRTRIAQLDALCTQVAEELGEQCPALWQYRRLAADLRRQLAMLGPQQ